ncbi:hypothetical protein ACF9IK_30580 [Kitasatospora hibisci]|uniref:hypothetical protein n=1 Tax=Kitasatospora hibisci TaxID=3369522 RepID=UPI003754B21B
MESIVQALRGWPPRDWQTAVALETLSAEPELFEVVGSHRTADGAQRFVVAFDSRGR